MLTVSVGGDVERTSDPPDDDVRKASSNMISGHGTNLKCVACVIEGSGFRAAITRSVLASMQFFIRTPSPIKFFESASVAATWMAGHINIGRVTAFDDQVAQLRQQLPYD